MADLLADIAVYFKTQGLITDWGNDCYGDDAPPSPDTITVLYEYLGKTPVECDVGVERYIQIMNRALTATAAKNAAWAIWNKLGRPNDKIMVTVTRFIYPNALGIPHKLRVDDKERFLWVCNYHLITTSD